ncbi:endonuclease/exonuclease/phosphatase family protein [Roseivivax halodurans]|nr:endonuclease/exonuclease/phosphatase family protein [Roseivivax halodurans]
MTDFPRLQYAIAISIVLLVLALAGRLPDRLRAALAGLLLAALAFNAVKLAPYLPDATGDTAACAPERRFSVMVANVKLENHHAAELLEIVREHDPDLLLALETTEWWDRHLAELSGEMPYSAARITGSFFGMHLLSRLPLSGTEVMVPVGQDTPAILSTVTLPAGDEVRFLGIHPRPPHPGQSSVGRDAVLMWSGLEASTAGPPLVLAGDLNAVPWERTVERLGRIGGLVDPRRIFGFLPTYDAHSWWMAWPLDQVLHTTGVTVTGLEVLRGFGSDHYPVEVMLCHQPTDVSSPELRPGDLDRARAIIAATTRVTPPAQ